MIKKIVLTLEHEKSTIGVELHMGDGQIVHQRNNEDVLTTLWNNSFTTGFLPASQDGLLYLESAEGKRVVVFQRGARISQPLTWDDHRTAKVLKVNTPWTIFVWRLAPIEGGWSREKEMIYTSTGPSLGAKTPLHSAEWLGNVYSGSGRSTNICWGSTVVAPGGSVSLPSLGNIANDFFYMPFTNHLGGSVNGWREFTQTGINKGRKICTLDKAILGAWA